MRKSLDGATRIYKREHSVASMRTRNWVLLIVVLAVTIGWTALSRRTCLTGQRLDQLLGGGPPVCFDGPWDGLRGFEAGGQLDEGDSGDASFRATVGGRTYEYNARPAHNYFGPAGASWRRIGRACVAQLEDSATVEAVAAGIRTRLQRAWQLAPYHRHWKAEVGTSGKR